MILDLEYLPCDLIKLCMMYLDSNECIYYCNVWDAFTCNKVCNIAIKYGWIDLLEWVKNKQNHNKYDFSWDEKIYVRAAQFGHLDILNYAYTNNCPTESNEIGLAYMHAAQNGFLDILKWLIANIKYTGLWDKYVCVYAAKYGHLDVLKWFRTQFSKNQCPMDIYTCAFAAEGGHLNVLKWLRDNRCPWNELTCTYAAANGHLDVLIWARTRTHSNQNECPWNESTCFSANKFNHVNILKWTEQNNCKCNGKYH